MLGVEIILTVCPWQVCGEPSKKVEDSIGHHHCVIEVDDSWDHSHSITQTPVKRQCNYLV